MGENLMLPACLLWVDPGGMTGLAKLERGRAFAADEFAFRDAGDRLWGICSGWRHGLHIGWEHARIHDKSPQELDQAIEVIGLARYFATIFGCTILQPQDPGDRKVAKPEYLRAIGIWVPGKDDAQSATQHLMAWCMRTNNVPPHWQVPLAEARQHG